MTEAVPCQHAIVCQSLANNSQPAKVLGWTPCGTCPVQQNADPRSMPEPCANCDGRIYGHRYPDSAEPNVIHYTHDGAGAACNNGPRATYAEPVRAQDDGSVLGECCARRLASGETCDACGKTYENVDD